MRWAEQSHNGTCQTIPKSIYTLYTLKRHADAEHDLLELRKIDPVSAHRIFVFLQELGNNQALLSVLLDHGYGSNRHVDRFHVSKWLELWNKQFDFWVVKIWSLDNIGIRYRIIYAYEKGTKNFHVLGIIPRDFNYNTEHPLTKRMLKAYGEIII